MNEEVVEILGGFFYFWVYNYFINMLEKYKKVIVWSPRVLVAFVILGLMVWDFYLFYLLYIPLIVVLGISWKKELFGAVVFFALTLGYIYGLLFDVAKFTSGFRFVWIGFLFFLITGILFALGFKLKAKNLEKKKMNFFRILLIFFTGLLIPLFFGLGWLSWAGLSMKTREFVIWKSYWYPQNINVTAKNTPEDTYTNFRNALLEDNIEGALEWVSIEKREEYREVFNNDKFLVEYKNLPDVNKIKKSEEDTYTNSTVYHFRMIIGGEEVGYSVNFTKDLDGIWYIESI